MLAERGLKLHEILELSPRQIASVYFHPRKEDGTVVAPEAQSTGVGRLHQLMGLIDAGMVKCDPEQVAELKRRIADGSGPATEADS